MAILGVLKSQGKPMSILEVTEALKNKINQVTVYRALEALTESRFLQKVNLQDLSTYYELVVGVEHHHHIVCEQCGAVEDIENCDKEKMEEIALHKSRKFDSIQAHSIEFFGVCNRCVKMRSVINKP